MSFGLGTVIPLLAFLAYATLLLMVLLRAPRSPLKAALAIYLAAMAAWSFCSFMSHLNSPILTPLAWQHLMGIGLLFAPWAVYYFITVFLDLRNQRLWLGLAFLVSLVLATISVTSNLIIERAQVVEGRLEYEFGPFFPVTAALTYALFILSLVYLVRALVRSRDPDMRNRIGYPTLGVAFILVGLQTNMTPLGQYASDIAFNLVNALLLTYAVSRYRLADITLGIRVSLVTAVIAAVTTGIFMLSFLLLQGKLRASVGLSELGAALITSFLVGVFFQPLRSGTERLVERVFGFRPYDFRRLLGEAGQIVSQSPHLEEVLPALQRLLSSEMEIEKSFVFILNPEQHSYTMVGATGEAGQAMLSLKMDSALLQVWKTSGAALSLDELASHPLGVGSQADREVLERLGASLLVPLRARGEVTGIMALGAKKNGFSYSDEDKRLLTAVANHVAATLDNARLYHESREAYQSLRQAQERLFQTERLRALGELAGGIVHDFNNALTTILSRAQLAREEILDGKLRKDLELIEQAALDSAQIVQRLRLFTTGGADKDIAPINVNEIIRSAVELSQPRLKEVRDRVGASIEMVLELETTRLVAANASNLREVFTNLIFNAVNAMPSGGRLTIESREVNGALEISFQDTGVGMDAEVQRHLFEPFFTTKKGKGTGLGLAISQKIISDYGGGITVSSAPHQGSKFVIRLPVTDQLPQAVEPATTTSQVGQVDVLAVDDDPGSLESLKEILSRAGCTVYAATSGTEALHRLTERGYAAIFTDLGMGDVGGFAVAEEAKKRFPNVPVVIVTGWGLSAEEVRNRSNVDEIIYKPFRKSEIEALVSRLLNSGRENQAQPVSRERSVYPKRINPGGKQARKGKRMKREE